MSRKAADGRWSSKFGRFAAEFGVQELATRLDVHPSAVYQWIRGKTSPDPARAIVILKIAGRKKLSMEQIYR